MVQLASPSIQYKDSFLIALAEFHQEKRYKTYYPKDIENFKTFVDRLNGFSKGKDLPEGYVPYTVLWLVDGVEFIGTLTIRHTLNEKLEHVGGHIGYDIRPAKRGRGYGKEILRLGLKRAKGIGINNVLITCDLENIPSKKIIEANGGILQEEYSLEGKKKLKFTIDMIQV